MCLARVAGANGGDMRRARIEAFLGRHGPLFVVVLGSDEIASAIAAYLTRAGRRVVLLRDPVRPVLRRAMSFDEAAFGETIRLDGVDGIWTEHGFDLAAILGEPGRVAIVDLDLNDILALRQPDVLIDARRHEIADPLDLRGIAAIVMGIGPGFLVGANCDVAVETHPAQPGSVVREGSTRADDGRSSLLAGAERDRLVRAPLDGRWRTALDLGRRIYRGMTLGRLDATPLVAPFDGLLRGILRDDTLVAAGRAVVEIDPRGRYAEWRGIDDRGRAIAAGAVEALDTAIAVATFGTRERDGESLH